MKNLNKILIALASTAIITGCAGKTQTLVATYNGCRTEAEGTQTIKFNGNWYRSGNNVQGDTLNPGTNYGITIEESTFGDLDYVVKVEPTKNLVLK
jgi:hypothetical protein